MVELSEADVANIKAQIDNLTAARKQDHINDLTPDRLKERINSIIKSDKNNNNKIDGTEVATFIRTALTTNPDGDKLFHALCELAATDDVNGRNAKQFLETNALGFAGNINFIREIAKATQHGAETPEIAIKSYKSFDMNTSNPDVRTHLDNANMDIALLMSKQIGEILKNDKVLADKTANLPDVSALALDAQSFCVGVNHRGIGRST